MTNIETVLSVAVSQIGKQEKPRGSNWGTDVKKYLDSVGINFPASWCMAFVHWCYDEACRKLCINDPLYRSGGVLSTWNHTDLAHRVTAPGPGDIFIFDYGKGLGHTGIIENISGSSMNTIEGNTNDTGSREGYEVCRRTRTLNKAKGFIRVFK